MYVYTTYTTLLFASYMRTIYVAIDDTLLKTYDDPKLYLNHAWYIIVYRSRRYFHLISSWSWNVLLGK